MHVAFRRIGTGMAAPLLPAGRGPLAVADMKARLADGWTVDRLFDRWWEAEPGAGFSYEYAAASSRA